MADVKLEWTRLFETYSAAYHPRKHGGVGWDMDFEIRRKHKAWEVYIHRHGFDAAPVLKTTCRTLALAKAYATNVAAATRGIDSTLTHEPCPRCLTLARAGHLRAETVQRLPAGAHAPLGPDGRPCCRDCQAADTLMRFLKIVSYEQARVVVANDRQEQYRMPGLQAGTVLMGVTRPSEPGDLERQHAWLDSHDWFGLETEGAS